MKDTLEDIERLEAEFQSCQKVLTAFGDEMQRHILCMMLKSECSGSRVIEIAQKQICPDPQFPIICRF